MAVETIEKQPYEKLDYDFNFKNKIDPPDADTPTGDTIQSATITTSPAGLTVSGQQISGTKVKVFLEGGASGTTYKITCQAVSVQGRKPEEDFNLLVSEK